MSAAAATAAPPGEVRHRGAITVSIMLATIMQALDTTIANVALPHMQGSLGAAQDQVSWVLTSYIVAAAIATPLTGWLTGRLGRKRLFMVSVTGFTIASMLCGLAQSLEQMVVFRLLQGLFGAALVPLSQAVLLDINPRENHGKAMAIWGAGIMVGPILGPSLGGWLTDNFDWRWVFYINLPVGILALAGIVAFVAETPRKQNQYFDMLGFTLLAVAIGAFQMMLDRGQHKDWFGSPEIVIEAALAGGAFYMFLAHSATTARPFFSPGLFKDANLMAGNCFVFVIGVILFATMALLPPLMQSLLEYPVVTAGMMLAPRGVGTMAAMMIVGRLVGRLDTRILLASGFLLIAFSLWQMTRLLSLQMDWGPFIWTGIIQGVGIGLVYVPLSAATFATLAPELRGEGTAMFSLLRNIGSSVGISFVETMLSRNMQTMHEDLGGHVTALNPLIGLPPAGSANLTSALAMLNGEVTRQAAMVAYVDDFKLMMLMTLAVVPLIVLLRPSRKAPSAEHAVIE
jgi:DHA2 family multidrug resistance protein